MRLRERRCIYSVVSWIKSQTLDFFSFPLSGSKQWSCLIFHSSGGIYHLTVGTWRFTELQRTFKSQISVLFFFQHSTLPQASLSLSPLLANFIFQHDWGRYSCLYRLLKYSTTFFTLFGVCMVKFSLHMPVCGGQKSILPCLNCSPLYLSRQGHSLNPTITNYLDWLAQALWRSSYPCLPVPGLQMWVTLLAFVLSVF